jgi:thioredoxin reductase (NADPH)
MATTKPAVLVIDDDREVLGAVERDLRRRYRAEYRVLSSSLARSGLDAVQELKRRGAAVALFLVDQRMPEISGTEWLVEARRLYPDAKRVLLTAYADTDAAIAAINEAGVDHYLLKPWDPPEERLYPVLDDLLAAWSASARPPFEGVRVAGSRWSPQSYAVRDFLSRNQVPYQWIDIDADTATREIIATTYGSLATLPVVFLPDGRMLLAPSQSELATEVGLHTNPARPFYDVVIAGGGPAGLANAVYGASEGLRVLLVEQSAPGGQAGTSSMIENYLGFPAGVTGADLATRAVTQARRFGAELLVGHAVAGARREDPYRIVTLTDGREISCHALVLATGMAVRELNIRGIEALLGAGVYYGAAMSEAVACRGQHVCVVGGANSAGQGALFFSRHARTVTMLVRAPDLTPTMSQYLADRIRATANITVVPRVELTAVCGSGHLERVEYRHLDTGEGAALDCAALFIFIGVQPRTEPFRGFVQMDDKGFILTGPDVGGAARGWKLDRDPLMFESSVPGVFAVGDTRANANRRIAAAVGEGSAAMFSIHQYLRTV